MAQRTMMFEETVMRFCGVQQIPTFDRAPAPSKSGSTPGGLGHKCGGLKIEPCLRWLQERAPKRVVNGEELKMIVTEEQLAATLCRTCKKG